MVHRRLLLLLDAISPGAIIFMPGYALSIRTNKRAVSVSVVCDCPRFLGILCSIQESVRMFYYALTVDKKFDVDFFYPRIFALAMEHNTERNERKRSFFRRSSNALTRSSLSVRAIMGGLVGRGTYQLDGCGKTDGQCLILTI
jgi:hypothetical protein